ncbi:MAG: hypothetical protein WC346_01435, partial [Methanogenium sp.]
MAQYIATVHEGSPYFTLLYHSAPGVVSLSATYTLAGQTTNDGGVDFYPQDGTYIAIAHTASPRFTLLRHTTPGSVSLATTYTLSGGGQAVKFVPDGDYIAVGHAT